MRSEVYMISLSLEYRDSFITYEENPGVPLYNCQRLNGGQESLRNGGLWEMIKYFRVWDLKSDLDSNLSSIH